MEHSVSVRELRNSVSEVVRRVEGGESLTVTVNRRPVAQLVPLRHRRVVPVAEAVRIVTRFPLDRGILSDLEDVRAETTDDL